MKYTCAGRFSKTFKQLSAMLFVCALAAPSARAAVPSDFAKKMTLTPSTSALAKISETAWADFPVLVRLPVGASALLQSANGTDLLFTDENDASLPFEVDTFDPAGETLVWVKVPSLSSATELTAYFGGAANEDNVPSAVWTNYAGVWHMNEASGTVADATGNGLGASPAKATAVSIAQTAGAVGTARQTATSDVKDYLTIPNYNSLGVGGNFTFSCFYDATARKGYDRLVSRKETYDAGNGWEVEMANANNKLSARGASGTSITRTFSDLVSSGWMRFVFVYSGSTLTAFLNGGQIGTGAITAATDNGKPLSIGCDSDGSEAYFVGYVDEARLRKGAASAAEVALEYATMADAAFFKLGAIESVDDTAQVFETPTVARNADGTYTVTVVLSENSGDVGVIYDEGEKVVTNILATAANPGTYTDTPANLTANTTYKFAAYGKNANGTEVVAKGGVFYNGDISIEKISDANENGLIPGAFRISRADTAHDLTVTYTVGGTAAAGQTYETLSGTATIPAGSSSVDVEVVPLIDAQTTSDTTVTVTLTSGLYGVDAQASSAEITVVNLVAPAGYNTWVATSDGLASVDSNWSMGVAPTASDNVLFDGRFSTANCMWDSSASATVASWTQNADYTGTVEIQTTYTSGAFPLLSIAGDCIVSGGKWTHPANNDSEAYRLKVSVGRDFTLASAATIDVTCKGYAKNKFPSGSGKGVHGGGCGGCGATYGDPFVPERLGSGYNTAGGGAVYLTVSGAAIVNGTITTAASQGATSETAYGAPGSIYLRAASITGSGYVYAHNPGGKRCAGGRIALHATESEEIGIPVSHMSVQGGFSSVRGGSGTLLLRTKNQEHGVLYIDTPTRTNYYINGYPTSDETTVIPGGQTWTVDGIDFRNSGILTVGPETTLVLPNGFASITGSARTAGILYNGGTITSAQASSETLSGAWTFQANRNYAFTGDVTVKNGASIGGLRLYQVTNYVDRVDYLCDVRVVGDLTVESGGFLSGDFSGYTYKTFADKGSYQNSERFGDPYAHGGQIFVSENGAYGSILNPAMPGTYGQTDDRNTQNLGGGALKLVVDGALTIDGTVTSVGGTSSGSGQGSGGSINITAGSLSGNGTMSASGCTATGATTDFVDMDYMLKNRGVKSASAGGRIAVRLTGSGASFSSHWIENILATGALNTSGGTVFSNGCASAGTVYLQTAADGEGGGTVYVRNGDQTTNPAVTPIPSARWGGERDDLTKASLAIGAAARVKLFDGLKMKSLEMTSETTLDLNGKLLIVKSAKVNGVKLAPGRYAAGDEAVSGFVVDSATDGELIVSGSGLSIIVR